MKVEKLVREFKYGSLNLADPDPAQTPEEVKAFYAGMYPELNNAEIEGPENKGGKALYTFRKAVGTKGSSHKFNAFEWLRKQALAGNAHAKVMAFEITRLSKMPHPFKGRLDRDCEVCGLADRNPIHSAVPSPDGIALIQEERTRQQAKLGYDDAHDDDHADGSLVLAAICYATPQPVFVMEEHSNGFKFADPWPASWDHGFDKRPVGVEKTGRLVDPRRHGRKLRIRSLVKAGALIAAEIDRLHRLEAKHAKKRKA